MQTPKTYIIIGRSGSGKGTQLQLLKTYLEKTTPEIPVQTYICGDAFRAFFKEETAFAKKAQEITNAGNYQPDFLATTLLFRDFVFGSINTIDHILVDGYPRSLQQLKDLKDLLVYIGRSDIVFIDIVVSKEAVTERMLKRARADDTPESIAKRQDEFDRMIVPMIEAIKQDTTVAYVAVDGMPLPEVVHQNVLQALDTVI